MADFESTPINGTAAKLQALMDKDIVDSIPEEPTNEQLPTAKAVDEFFKKNSGAIDSLSSDLNANRHNIANISKATFTKKQDVEGEDVYSVFELSCGSKQSGEAFAVFSDGVSGMPIRLSGVADGVSDNDAATYGQLLDLHSRSEHIVNRVSLVDEASDNEHYPTAKAVYDALSKAALEWASPVKYINNQDADNRISIRNIETGPYIIQGYFCWYDGGPIVNFNSKRLIAIARRDTESEMQMFYPSGNKVAYAFITDSSVTRQDVELNKTESTDNRVNTIDSTADDEHYPTAKAVYDALSSVDPGTASVGSVWDGKKLLAFGTSVTWACRNYDGGYLRIVKDRNGFAEFLNEGVSGAAMANNTANGNGINYKIKNSSVIGNYDLVIIECSTNDFKLNVDLGEVGVMGDTAFDTDTFCGALRDSIEHILTNYPQKHILLIADTQRNNASYDVNHTNTAGHKLIDYVDALKSIAELYGLPVCDWYRESGFNALTLSQYTTDGLHPNALGYVVLGNLTASAVADMYCNFEMVQNGGELVFVDLDIVRNEGYLAQSGAATPQSGGNWRYTDLISATAGEKFKYFGSTLPGSTNIPAVCGYNANGVFVQIILEKGDYIEGQEFVIPDGVSAIRCCYYVKDTITGLQKEVRQ